MDVALGFGAVGIGTSAHPNTGRLALLPSVHVNSEDDVEVSLDIQATIGRAWVAAVNRVGSLSLAWQSEAAAAQDELSRDMEAMLVFDTARGRPRAATRERHASLWARSATSKSGGSSNCTVRSDDRPAMRLPRHRRTRRQQAPGHTQAQPMSFGLRVEQGPPAHLPVAAPPRRSASLPPPQTTAYTALRLAQGSPEAAPGAELADRALSLSILEEQVSDMFIELGAHSPYVGSTRSAGACPGGAAPCGGRPAATLPPTDTHEGRVVLADDDDDDSNYSDEPTPTARSSAASTAFVRSPKQQLCCPGLCPWCPATDYARDSEAAGCTGVEAALERVELADIYLQRVGRHASVIDALLADLRAQSRVLSDTLAASQAQASQIGRAVQTGPFEQTMRGLYKRSRALRAHGARCHELDVQHGREPGQLDDRLSRDDTLLSGSAFAVGSNALDERARSLRTGALPPKTKRTRRTSTRVRDIDHQWAKLRSMLDAAATSSSSSMGVGRGPDSDVVVSGLKVVDRTLRTVIEYLGAAPGDPLLAE
ncbi:hypothetical protein H4R19_003603 [Coemansia spiralis]|nr:hypothetical protein H4R19_003603 [Coemansia spiralis]